jgi:hypothetical protein
MNVCPYVRVEALQRAITSPPPSGPKVLPNVNKFLKSGRKFLLQSVVLVCAVTLLVYHLYIHRHSLFYDAVSTL